MKNKVLKISDAPEFSEYLSKLIDESSKSKSDISKSLNVTIGYVSGMCSGKDKPPTFARIEEIANFLKLSPKIKQSLYISALKIRIENKPEYEYLKGIGIIEE